MKVKIYIIILLSLFTMFLISCDKKKTTNHTQLTTSQALTQYDAAETNLTASLGARDATMDQITQKINALGSKSNRDANSDISALFDTYVTQSEQTAAYFDDLIALEDAIIPYGDQGKNIFGSIARGVYNIAKNKVVQTGQQARSCWRLVSGQKSLREVLVAPDSGIPFLSDIAQRLQNYNAGCDATIRNEILANTQDNPIPMSQLTGNTNQEKLNYYLNLPDDDPLKKQIRGDVIYWDDEQKARAAALAKELAEVAVKKVADEIGNDTANDIFVESQSDGQDDDDKGTLNLTINNDATGNPPIGSSVGKTIIISKKNQPESDPRITIYVNAPQSINQDFPSGMYDFIVLADGFIRSTVESLTIVQGQVKNQMVKLMDRANNAIVIQNMTADPETVPLNSLSKISVNCVSTIGQDLTFTWAITGGTYTNSTNQQNNFSFKPTQEGTYTVTVTITDGENHTKTQSIQIQVIAAQLLIDHYTFSNESFTDSKINPGELVTMSLYIKNTGTTDLTGAETAEGLGGITVAFNSTPNALIPAGETGIWDINVLLPVNYSETTGSLLFKFATHDAANTPVTISLPVDFPVEFYVTINPITAQPVTNRVLTLTGKIANPQVTEAVVILDNDLEHELIANVSNGVFSRDIAIGGSSSVLNHTVKVMAVSGSNTEEASTTFTSNVPLSDIRMTLTWDTGGTDVDFWCTDPNGAKCFYANLTTSSGLVLDFDDRDGYGPENITTSTTIPGDYLVQVHFFSTHATGAVPTSCQVVIRQNEGQADQSTTNYYGNISETGDIWNVTTLHIVGTKFTQTINNTYGKYVSESLPPKAK